MRIFTCTLCGGSGKVASQRTHTDSNGVNHTENVEADCPKCQGFGRT